MKSKLFKSHADTIKTPLAQSKDINARNIREHVPLHLATANGNSDVVNSYWRMEPT